MRKLNLRYTNAIVVEENNIKELDTFEEVIENYHWMKAMEKEIAALKQNQTWNLVPKPNDTKSISYKWVYKIKKHLDSSVERNKARLVARGFL